MAAGDPNSDRVTYGAEPAGAEPAGAEGCVPPPGVEAGKDPSGVSGGETLKLVVAGRGVEAGSGLAVGMGVARDDEAGLGAGGVGIVVLVGSHGGVGIEGLAVVEVGCPAVCVPASG